MAKWSRPYQRQQCFGRGDLVFYALKMSELYYISTLRFNLTVLWEGCHGDESLPERIFCQQQSELMYPKTSIMI